ncbi:zinc metalloprotease HtpX [Candidatus Gracilibacteria bacterium CG1_02_38_174]|nr:MAG: zinc metalloprotease HtpX [Candidatus Gracilibacteria bacterium CG1_02_38_174]PIZ01719.1 MAG: protease HtpX [Candidatus Gracilibacteria bacterium CG_4_10_14_0_8_um_filter_38_28]
MNFFKRIFLFLATNIAIILVITAIIFVLERYFGFHISSSVSNGYGGLFVFALIFGFVGSFISLAISRWMAKRAYDIQLISETRLMDYDSKTQMVYTTVSTIAKQNGIDMPEVGVYESADPNAFATGPSKNKSLVAVSTGLLESMTAPEIEGVIAHEMSHILNGDMVTMTLLQGVLNTFVIFFARIIGSIIDKTVFKNEEGNGWGYFITVIVLEIILGILASLVLMAFSRYREYRADEGSSRLVGKDKMILALKRLQYIVTNKEIVDDGKLATFKIHSEKGFMTLFMSHPDLDDRIKNLENNYQL